MSPKSWKRNSLSLSKINKNVFARTVYSFLSESLTMKLKSFTFLSALLLGTV